MYRVSNFTDNDDVKTLDQKGPFTVIEYQRDLSVTPGSAVTAFYCAQMNVKKRQVICDLNHANITIQAGAMQWMLGNVSATTGIKGVGDLFGKAVRGKVTGESAIKPEYTGSGMLVLEPTYKHLLLMDAADWGGSVVLDDGLFLACDSPANAVCKFCSVLLPFNSMVIPPFKIFYFSNYYCFYLTLVSRICQEVKQQYPGDFERL